MMKISLLIFLFACSIAQAQRTNTMANYVLDVANQPYRSGVTNIPSLAVSLDVVFNTPLDSINYTPQAVSMFYLATVTFSYSNITTNGFRINLSTGVAGGGEIRYFAWPYR